MSTHNGTSVTRERILEAARPVVERFTVAKFGMEDVARAAGIARQTIYKHFSGRDDLLVAMFVQQLSEMREDLAESAAADPSAEQLVTLFVEELKSAKKFPLFDAMLDPAVAPKMAELVFSSDEMSTAREATWFPILERYVASGVVADDVDFAQTVRWINYQQFWFLTHPTVLTSSDDERETYVRNFVVKALLAK